MTVRRVFFGLDPAPDDALCLRVVARSLERALHGQHRVLPDAFVEMLPHDEAREAGLRWVALGMCPPYHPVVAHEATTVALGELLGARTPAVVIDELRRVVAFSAWIDRLESYWLASCGSIVSGDIDLLTVDYPQRDHSVDELASIELELPTRRSTTQRALLDASCDAATLGLAQWFPGCAPDAYRGVLAQPRVHQITGGGRSLERAREVPRPVRLVDLHELRPEYRELAVPWDRRSWDLALPLGTR
jgi:hypothetical protein